MPKRSVCAQCGKPFKMQPLPAQKGWTSEGICQVRVEWIRGLPYRVEVYHPDCFRQAASHWMHGIGAE